MLTRCPNCQTTFRVAPEQIRARHGRVRCGECLDVFNALDTLVDEPMAAALPPEADGRGAAAADVFEPAPTAAFPVPDIVPLPVERPAETTCDTPVDAPVDAATAWAAQIAVPPPLYFGPPIHESDSTAAATAPPPVEASPAPVDTATEQADAIADTTPPVAQSPVATADDDAAALVAPLADDAALAAAALAAVAQGTATKPAVRPAWRPSHAEVRVPDAADGATETEDTPAASASRPLWRSLLLVLAMALAAAALLFQAALHWRVELATLWPSTRPLYDEACALFDCTVELPRKASLIGIESSDLHPDPNDKTRLVLRATLRNRAPFAQAWPHLELTLTDTADRALARRVLAPVDYLPAAVRIQAGIASHADAPIERPLSAADADAAGYRLYLFYP